MRKFVWIGLAALILILLGAYLAASYVVYDTLADIEGGCWERGYGENQPTSFGVPAAADMDAAAGTRDGWPVDFDFSQYFMETYETVSFPSRDPEISITGWFVPGDEGAPAVILTHGLGTCKNSPGILTPAGILNGAGYHVLMIDVRDAGDSTFEDGRSAMGTEEHRDILGAWDWLIAEKGLAPEQIGLLGNSMGAGTTLVAFAQEPRVAAAFVDSPFADLQMAIEGELQGNSYPTWLAPGGILMARLASGDNITAYDPRDAARLAAGRPLMAVHSRADERLSFHHTEILAEDGAAAGNNVDVWIVDGATHNRILGRYPQEFAQRLVGFFDAALRS